MTTTTLVQGSAAESGVVNSDVFTLPAGNVGRFAKFTLSAAGSSLDSALAELFGRPTVGVGGWSLRASGAASSGTTGEHESSLNQPDVEYYAKFTVNGSYSFEASLDHEPA